MKLSAMFAIAEQNHLLTEDEGNIYFHTVPRIENKALCHSSIAILPSEYQKNPAAFMESYDGYVLVGLDGKCKRPPVEYFQIHGDTEVAVDALRRLNDIAACAKKSQCQLPNFENASEELVRERFSQFKSANIAEVFVSDVDARTRIITKSSGPNVATSSYVETYKNDKRLRFWIDELSAP